MISAKLRGAAAGAAVALIFAVGFPESLGLWPLRLLAAWPAELGRALGNLFTAGKLAPLALGQSLDLQLFSTSLQGRAFAAALGLSVQALFALAFLWIAQRPAWPRRLFAALAAVALIAALLPPTSSLVSAAEVGLALACGILAAVPQEAPRTVALALLAGTAATTSLADLRPVLLSTGRVQGALATLEAATGVAASAFALLFFGLFAAAAFVLFRRQEAASTTAPPPSSEPATVPPP